MPRSCVPLTLRASGGGFIAVDEAGNAMRTVAGLRSSLHGLRYTPHQLLKQVVRLIALSPRPCCMLSIQKPGLMSMITSASPK